jgi:hypothetical protein
MFRAQDMGWVKGFLGLRVMGLAIRVYGSGFRV